VAHATCLGTAWDELETVGQHVFLEGVTTVASAQLAPGYDAATYAWAGKPFSRRGLSLAEWHRVCEVAWPHVSVRLRHDLAATDTQINARYFLGYQSPEDLPERVGYFAGWHLVSAFAREYTVAALARWPPQRIQERVAQALEDPTLEHPPRAAWFP
jgi:hypothetical protein